MITARERAQAQARARTALQHLEQNTDTTATQLGAARDDLNMIRNARDPEPVWDAVATIERQMSEVVSSIDSDSKDETTAPPAEPTDASQGDPA